MFGRKDNDLVKLLKDKFETNIEIMYKRCIKMKCAHSI